jgi:hypothetical protein
VTGRVILTALGVAVALLVYFDAFLTVFHARGRGGPLTRWLGRLVWRLFRITARWRRPAARDRWLSLAAPSMVVLAIAAWGFLLIAGFALIYRPWLSHFLVSPGRLHDSWTEALYFSGYAATTLGLGDVVADTPPLRFLSVLEAFSGFALVTLAITYLLGVYGAVLTMGVLAGRIDAFFRADDVRALDYGDPEVRSAFLRWTEQTTGELLHVLQAHFQYPILHNLRPMDPERSFSVQFRHLLVIHRVVEDEGAPEGALGGLRDHPSVRALSLVVRRYLEAVSSIVAPKIGGSDDTVAQREQSYRRLREYMAYPEEGP